MRMSLDESEVWPLSASGTCVDGEATNTARGNARGVSGSGPAGRPPWLPVQVPRSPLSSVQLPPLGLRFDKYCAEQVAPADNQGNSDNLTYDELRRPCSQHGYARKDSRAAMETRLNMACVVGRKRDRDMVAATDTLDEPIKVR